MSPTEFAGQIARLAPQSDEDLLDIAIAFRRSRTLLAACELDVFTAIGEESRSAAEIAERIGADPAAVARLLDALCAMGLLSKSDERYRNLPVASRHLVRGGDEYLALEYWAEKWNLWSQLPLAVQSGKPIVVSLSSPPAAWIGALWRRTRKLLQRTWMVLRRSDRWLRAFVDFMSAHARHRAAATLRILDLEGVHSLLDIGGGPAHYAMAFARQRAGLKVTVFDRPEIAEIARRNIAAAGMEDQVTAVGGDFLSDALPAGFDLVFICETAHANSDADNVALIGGAADATLPGGRVIVQDFILDDDRAGPLFASLFALDMLLTTEGGNNYTEADVRRWMSTAGLERIERFETDRGTAIMVGHRPE